MRVAVDDVVTWLIVGTIAGSVAGMLVTRRKEGLGRLLNLVVGLVGALIGGLLFKLLHVDLGLLGQVTVSLQEVIAGVVGCLVLLGIVWIVRTKRSRAKQTADASGTPERS